MSRIKYGLVGDKSLIMNYDDGDKIVQICRLVDLIPGVDGKLLLVYESVHGNCSAVSIWIDTLEGVFDTYYNMTQSMVNAMMEGTKEREEAQKLVDEHEED